MYYGSSRAGNWRAISERLHEVFHSHRNTGSIFPYNQNWITRADWITLDERTGASRPFNKTEISSLFSFSLPGNSRCNFTVWTPSPETQLINYKKFLIFFTDNHSKLTLATSPWQSWANIQRQKIHNLKIMSKTIETETELFSVTSPCIDEKWL